MDFRVLTLLLLVWLITITYSLDLLDVYAAKQTCLDALGTYTSAHDLYKDYLDDCFSKYKSGEVLCDKNEWNAKYNSLLSSTNDVKEACNRWARLIESKKEEIHNGFNQYCDKKGHESECNYYTSLDNELSDIENDAWSYEIYDTDGDGMPDMLESQDTDYSKCQEYAEPCDYIFGENTQELNIMSPKSNVIKRMNNGDVSLEVEVSVPIKPQEIYATFTQKKKGKYRGIIYSAQLQKEGQNYWAQIYLHKNEIYDGPAVLEIVVNLGNGELRKTIPISIVSNNKESILSNNTDVKEGEKEDTSIDTSIKDTKGKHNDYVESMFKGIKVSAVSSESIKTKKELQDISSIKGLKVSIVETPYGEMTIIEKPTNKKGMIGYQEKKKIVKVTSGFFGKILEKVKEKLGLSFGDKAASYFVGKGIENIVYNEDDKIKKTEEDLGVDKNRAKLFNDIVDTDKRDVYNVVKEELPDNEVIKETKEALSQLEKFHDRAAANGLAFEYKTVEQTVKAYVKGMTEEQLEKKREVLRNIAVENVEDYSGSVYRNGNRLISNTRFLNVIAKDKGDYDFRDPRDRAKYYFDLLWKSGKIKEWAQR